MVGYLFFGGVMCFYDVYVLEDFFFNIPLFCDRFIDTVCEMFDISFKDQVSSLSQAMHLKLSVTFDSAPSPKYFLQGKFWNDVFTKVSGSNYMFNFSFMIFLSTFTFFGLCTVFIIFHIYVFAKFCEIILRFT